MDINNEQIQNLMRLRDTKGGNEEPTQIGGIGGRSEQSGSPMDFMRKDSSGGHHQKTEKSLNRS